MTAYTLDSRSTLVRSLRAASRSPAVCRLLERLSSAHLDELVQLRGQMEFRVLVYQPEHHLQVLDVDIILPVPRLQEHDLLVRGPLQSILERWPPWPVSEAGDDHLHLVRVHDDVFQVPRFR